MGNTNSIHVEDSRVKLPRLGWIRLKERGYLLPESESLHILSATVSERAGRWFVSLQVEELAEDPTPVSGPPVGIDLGVKTLAACSFGEGVHVHYENPQARGARAHSMSSLPTLQAFAKRLPSV